MRRKEENSNWPATVPRLIAVHVGSRKVLCQIRLVLTGVDGSSVVGGGSLERPAPHIKEKLVYWGREGHCASRWKEMQKTPE